MCLLFLNQQKLNKYKTCVFSFFLKKTKTKKELADNTELLQTSSATQCPEFKLIIKWNLCQHRPRRLSTKFGWLPPTGPVLVTNLKCCDSLRISKVSSLIAFEIDLQFSFCLCCVLANNVAICSFGRKVVQSWRSNIDLPCRPVGNLVQPNWTYNGKSMDDQKQFQSNNKSSGFISLSDLKRSDTGNYTCSVTTGFISDSITYQLVVLGILKKFISISEWGYTI